MLVEMVHLVSYVGGRFLVNKKVNVNGILKFECTDSSDVCLEVDDEEC